MTSPLSSKFKDIKNIQPIIEQINQESEKLNSISNDELREKTNAFKNRIEESLGEEKRQVETLKNQAAEENKFTQDANTGIYIREEVVPGIKF